MSPQLKVLGTPQNKRKQKRKTLRNLRWKLIEMFYSHDILSTHWNLEIQGKSPNSSPAQVFSIVILAWQLERIQWLNQSVICISQWPE
jgi:hypothetical protein